MNNEFKTQLQQREFLALKDSPRVILRWATGCGKSKMAIDLINHIVRTHNNIRVVKVLFVVAERAHIKNWQDEFDKWHLRTDRVATDVICYASLHKVKDNSTYHVIVYDEAHHLFTEKRKAIAESLHAPCVFLLSATLSPQKVEAISEIYGNFKVSTVTLKDAIKKDILADPRVYLIEMELDNKNPVERIVLGSGDNLPLIRWEDRNQYIFKNAPCIIQCTAQEKYIFLTNKMEYWKQRYEKSKNPYHHNMWVNTGSTRKRFLGELKTEAVYRLTTRMPKYRRYVCFCASVNQADMLSRNTISSRKASSKNQYIIDSFNARRINNIYAVGMITEGMNLADIQAGIIVQLDGKERLFIQKFGRSLRSQDPVSYIFYFKGTQDEVYLKNALENIEGRFIRRLNTNQLNTIKL